jgi:protein O-GlcNAc transferase
MDIKNRAINQMKNSNKSDPNTNPNMLFQQAVFQHQSGNIDIAIEIYRLLKKQYPKNPQVLYMLGTAEFKKGNYLESIDLLGKSIKISPNNPEAHNDQGIAFKKLKRFDEALQSYNRAIQLKPYYPVPHINRGTALIELKRFEEALQSFDRAIQLNSDYPVTHYNRGVALNGLKRFDEAILSFDLALQLNPDYLEAHNNRGTALVELKRFDEAMQSFDLALQLNPDYPETHFNRGIALKELKRFDEALQSFDLVLQLKPDKEYLLGMWFYVKLGCCDWNNFYNNKNKILNGILKKTRASDPFLTLLLTDTLDIQKQSAMIWVKDKCYLSNSTIIPTKYPLHDKIRIGYFSADYHDHPVTHLIAEMLEMHDRSKYELYGFSFGPESNDPWRIRAQKSFDHFFDVRFMSDQDIAMLSRDHQIDIAIDLMGFTADLRTNIFAKRAAPVQVNYLGYPGTMGAGFIDYIIADKTIIPESDRHYFTEKVVYLPNNFQANCRTRNVSLEILTRTELNLPQDGFVYCCFNNNNKITPTMFDSWMRILQQVDESALWLYVSNKWAEDNLRMEAEKRGINAERLVFAKFLPIEEHLNRIRHADLFLDTLPFNAGATASDALRMGVPLVTHTGNAFAGRYATSLLKTLDMEELITHSAAEYEALAVDLAIDRDRLQRIKEKLNANVQTSSLYDSDKFTRHIEKAYELMYERYRNDLDPDHIIVEA